MLDGTNSSLKKSTIKAIKKDRAVYYYTYMPHSYVNIVVCPEFRLFPSQGFETM